QFENESGCAEVTGPSARIWNDMEHLHGWFSVSGSVLKLCGEIFRWKSSLPRNLSDLSSQGSLKLPRATMCDGPGLRKHFGKAFHPSWEPDLDTPVRIHLPSGFHIEIGDRDLPCPLLCERPEGFPDNRVVPDLTAVTVTKDQNCGGVLCNRGRRLWRRYLSSLLP